MCKRAALPLSVAAEPAADNRLADTDRAHIRYRHIPELISGVNRLVVLMCGMELSCLLRIEIEHGTIVHVT